MKIKREILAVFFAVLVIPLTCAGGFAETDVGDYSLGGYLSLGGGFLSDAPRHMNRGYLKQYLPFPEGFLADADLSLKSKDGLEYYKFRMSHPGLRDEDFLIQVGKIGVYHVEIEYDQLQHLYCTVNPYSNVGTLLQRVQVKGYYSPTRDIDIFAENQFLRRTGQQPASFGGGPGSGGYNFTTYLRPIDYRQNDAKVGAEINRPLYQFRVAYNVSTFDNGGLTDFRVPGSANWVSLAPSNMANYVTVEGALKLDAYKTRLTNSFTYGWLDQDDHVFNGNDTFAGAAGLSASTVTGNITGVTRPIEPLTLRYSYRVYDYMNDNRSNKVLANAFSGTNQPLLNMEQYSYLRQTATTGVDYKVNNKMAFDAGYSWQGVDRTNIQGHTSSNSPQVGMRLFPTSWLNLTANYAYTARQGSNFLLMAPTNVLTYKSYSGNNRRNNVNFIAEVFPVNDLTFSFNYSVYNDNFCNSGYGLQNDQGWSGGGDVSWRPAERIALSLGYDHQQATTKELAPNPNTRTGYVGRAFLVTGDSGPILRTTDTYDTITGKADFKLIPNKLKLTVGASYSFSTSYFKNDVMPNLHENFLDVNTSLTYTYDEHWGCKVGYIYENFIMTKAYQTLYLQGITSTGATPSQSFNTLDGFYRNASAHLVQGFLQYKF